MKRIGFIGAPGSGKTTLATALYSALKVKNPNVKIELITEYARQYLRTFSIESVWDQYYITQKQMEREISAEKYPTEFIITDSPIHLTLPYAIDLVQRNSAKSTDKDKMVVSEIFSYLSKYAPSYDVLFLLPLREAEADGVRPDVHLDENWQSNMHNLIVSCFQMFPPKRFLKMPEDVTTISSRIDFVMKNLDV